VLVALEDDGAGGFVAVETETLGGPLDPSRLLFESTLPLMSVLLDRELALEAGGFDPALDYFEDWDLFLRLSRTVTFAHCPRVTARYLVAPGQGHGSGMTGAHRWPHLATLFERHRERIRGADWARFYRAQVESVRLHARALEGQLRECAAQREEERAGVRALGDRVAQLEQQVITAERARRRVEEVLLSVERSRVFRVTQRVRRLLGRR
jgi:hypothetical protein